jgi:hypothetical protein
MEIAILILDRVEQTREENGLVLHKTVLVLKYSILGSWQYYVNNFCVVFEF